MLETVYDKFLKYKERSLGALKECTKKFESPVNYSFADYEAGYTDRMKEEDNGLLGLRIAELTNENLKLTAENEKLKKDVGKLQRLGWGETK